MCISFLNNGLANLQYQFNQYHRICHYTQVISNPKKERPFGRSQIKMPFSVTILLHRFV